jgi:hypothetical protein
MKFDATLLETPDVNKGVDAVLAGPAPALE